MKSIFSIFIIFFLLTPQVHAATTTQNEVLIQKLLAQIDVLRAELAKLIAEKGGSTTPSCTFTRLLVKGTQGTDVTCLQTYLKKKGHFQGTPTGLFGPVTEVAVASWQRAEGIVAEPWEYGRFGEQSRGVYARTRTINNPVISTNPTPVITDVTPSGNQTTPSVTITPKTETKKRTGGVEGVTTHTDRSVVTVPDRATSVSDTTAPTTPGAFSFSSITATTLTLSWASSTDAVGVTGYRIYRGASQVDRLRKTRSGGNGRRVLHSRGNPGRFLGRKHPAAAHRVFRR